MPPCFIGVPYEACVAVKSQASVITAQAVTTTGNGLPAGLALDLVANPGSLRITGTPTGAASGGLTPKSGLGAYAFTLGITDTAGAGTVGPVTINLYQSPQDLIMMGQHGPEDGLN
jgi:hypothetical protein